MPSRRGLVQWAKRKQSVYDTTTSVFVELNRIVDETTKEAAAVDPVEPEKVLEASNSLGLTLKFVLTTHHH
ncbi:hydroxyacylglutathione hydrolase, partial [Trifolium medium]|nr:hydroxyacylglutathione hydrolase [Trifolium medium]